MYFTRERDSKRAIKIMNKHPEGSWFSPLSLLEQEGLEHIKEEEALSIFSRLFEQSYIRKGNIERFKENGGKYTKEILPVWLVQKSLSEEIEDYVDKKCFFEDYITANFNWWFERNRNKTKHILLIVVITFFTGFIVECGKSFKEYLSGKHTTEAIRETCK